MKVQNHTSITLFVFTAVLFAGCSTISSRVSKNQRLFDSYPAAVQADIRAGKVDIGYTPEMVAMALGEPDRRYTRITAGRDASEVWAYKSKAPSFSFGLGVGGGGGRTAVGTGVGITTGGERSGDRMRVIFKGGKVTSVEQAG